MNFFDQRGTAFSPEQTDKCGLQKAWGLFGKDLDALMDELNVELVA